MANVNEQIKKYMEEHRELLSRGDDTKALCFDGIVDEEKYFSICFLLKETNITDPTQKQDWSYVNWLYYNQLHKQVIEKSESTDLYKTYHNTCMWTAEFIDMLNGNDIRYSDYTYNNQSNGSLDLEKVRPVLEKIAIINLKKTWGGSSTEWRKLNQYINDKSNDGWIVNKGIQDVLVYEMSLIKPRIVICGGQQVYDFAKKIFINNQKELILTTTEAFESNGALFVKFRHPACRGKRISQFEYAKSIFEEIIPIIK